MKGIKIIFLDFDGVILESVDVKGWAFGKLFASYPDHVDEIVAFHHANGGMSRFDKFRHIYDDILNETLTEKQFRKLCDTFSHLVFNRVLECPFVPGALEFLKQYHRTRTLYVISGTPHDEINAIVDRRKLRPYFQGVFGSPESKGNWTRKIMAELELPPERAMFVGDAMSDLDAAQDNGIRFIARVTEGNDIFQDKTIEYKINDLFDLDFLLGGRGIK